MTRLSEEGIVFDKVFFEAILKKAAQEGFIKYNPPTWAKTLEFERVTAENTKIALQTLLLYSKAYYPDFYLNTPIHM